LKPVRLKIYFCKEVNLIGEKPKNNDNTTDELKNNQALFLSAPFSERIYTKNAFLGVLLGLSHHDLLHAVLNSVQVALPRQQQVVELLPLLSAEGSVHRARHVHFLGRLVHSGAHQLCFQYCQKFTLVKLIQHQMEQKVTFNDEFLDLLLLELQLLLDLAETHVTAALGQLHERQQPHFLHVLVVVQA
jgi:hypothetical protein